MIRKIVVFNNPWLEYHVELDLISGQAFYKTNVGYTGNPANLSKYYECFFLVPKERIDDFLPQLKIIQSWDSIYEPDIKGIILDGFEWSISIFGDCERVITGCQHKPKEFDAFISALEVLLQKDFT